LDANAGDRLVNQGGEPGQDDYGLPRVDIQIPDDARELDRDVQVYYRELRAIRRQERSRRWRTPLHRTGMVVPLIAGCLVLAMLASMALTMFSANPYFSGTAGQNPSAGRRPATPGSSANRSARPATAAPTTGAQAGATPSESAAGPLPSQAISVSGRPVTLSTLTSTALAIVPANCRCGNAVGQLLSQAAAAGIPVYLVGKRGSLSELISLAPTNTKATTVLAIDVKNVLYTAYKPVGLTLLLVDSHGSVKETHSLQPGFRLEAALKSLKPAK
jgi:hypothetical protein